MCRVASGKLVDSSFGSLVSICTEAACSLDKTSLAEQSSELALSFLQTLLTPGYIIRSESRATRTALDDVLREKCVDVLVTSAQTAVTEEVRVFLSPNISIFI